MENKPTRDEKEFRVLLHTSGKRYGKSYEQQTQMIAKALGAGAEKLIIEVVDYEALTHKDKQIEGLLEALKNACACSTRHAGWCPQCKYLAQMKEEHGE